MNQSKESQMYQDLGYEDVQQLVSEDYIDIAAIERKTLVPSDQIKKKLLQNQQHLIKQFMEPYSKFELDNKDSFRLNKFFPNSWRNNHSNFWPERIQMQQIYEITGKTNSGKTFFCYCLLEESLSNDKNVFVFDTANNFSAMKLCEWFGAQFIDKYKREIKRFEVSTLKQLGEQLCFLQMKLKQQNIPSVIIIDSLSTLIDSIPFSDNSSAFFALRKQFFSLIESTHCCILFTTLSHQSLFPSIYHKVQEQRFKNIHATMWESLTNNGILIDSALEHSETDNKIIRSTKMCLIRSATQNRFAGFESVQY